MQIEETSIPDVKLITPRKFGDERGFFAEVYNERAFAAAGIEIDFVQDNHAMSRDSGVIRGLHYQRPPFAQHKLLRLVRGAVFDVAVDIRRSSPTFGRHVTAVLSADAFNQILVPVGFAHGYCTLEPETEVLYKVSNFYAQDHEGGIAWDDPALAIPWPVASDSATLSDRDRTWPRLVEAPHLFE